MLTMTTTAVAREHLWTAFRRTLEVRLRERYRAILLLIKGRSCPEGMPWLYRDEATLRSWAPAFHEAGLQGPERTPGPGRPT